MSGSLLNSGLNVPFPSVRSFVGGPQTFIDEDWGVGAALHDFIRSEVGAALLCQDEVERLSCEDCCIIGRLWLAPLPKFPSSGERLSVTLSSVGVTTAGS